MKGKKKKLMFLATVTAAMCLWGFSACGVVQGGNSGNLPENTWTVEKVYARAQELGYAGTLEELLDELRGENGKDGKDGKDGVGVTEIVIENDNLIIRLTDGRVIDCGKVTGTDGKDGKDGQDGIGIVVAEINNDGNLILTLSDGNTLDLGKVTGENGTDGADGTNGKGISNVLLNEDGELIVYFTDNTSENIGVIKGADGNDGTPGADGVGIQNIALTDGNLSVTLTSGTVIDLGNIKGQNGADGNDGVGVAKTEINESGELVLTYTNGNSVNLGKVTGENGTDGKDGQDGIGIQTVTLDESGNLSVTLTSGTVIDLGNIKGQNGKDGNDGVGVAKTEINEAGELVLTYTNGNSVNLGKVTAENGTDGKDGQDGIGIQTVTLDESGNLSVTLTSGTVIDLGNIKGQNGVDGNDGVGVAKTEINEAGELVFTYTNGNSVNLGKVTAENGSDGKDGQDGIGIASVAFNAEGELVVTMTDGSVTNCGRPPVCNHTYSEWELGRAATCTSIGYYQHTCSKCGNVEYDFIEETGHDYGAWQDMISTCTEHWQVRICTVCDDSQVKSAEPVGHRYVDNVCVICGEVDGDNADLSYLDVYNGTYGYEYLGTMNNGEAMQALYEAIDKEVRIFHVNTALDAEDLTVASLNFAQLGLTADEAVSVWKTYKDDNPLYYWLANTVTCTADSITLLTESEYADGVERNIYNKLIYNQIESYSSLVSESDGVYRIALAYHDFIIDAIDYAYTADGQPETAAWAHNILGVFNETGAVCEGYARSFQILLNYSGVENLFVTGTANGEAHAWNLVQLDDGNWYWCDLTWDDSFVGGLNTNWKWGIAYNYFCVNDNINTLWSEGGWNYDSTKTFLDTHTFDTSAGTGISFLYELPARSAEEFFDGAQALLNTEFTVNNCDFTVVGYNTVELNYIAGSGSVEIPETVTYNGITYTVISLGVRGSEKSGTVIGSGITSVYVPETVKFIWDFAFRQCNLENIYVDEKNPWFRSQDGVLFTKSLYTLISYPSANARTEYVIPDETREIAYWSFDGCEYLETLTFGKNVSVIGITNWGGGYHDAAPNGWFGGNIVTGGIDRIGNALTGNKAIIIDENNKNYTSDDFAVYNYDKSAILYIFDKEITTYKIPANLMSIDSPSTGSAVFSDCTKLESFTIEEGNQWFSVYDGVLYNKEMTEIISVPLAIKGDITIPEGVTHISYSDVDGRCGIGFSNCENLTGVTLPETLTVIGNSAFSGCTNLKEINIPETVTIIGAHAFFGCSSLENIVLPENLIYIGAYAFTGTPYYLDGNNWEEGALYWGKYLISASGSGIFTVKDGTTGIAGYAFGASNFEKVIIPEGVTFIGSQAFNNCHALTVVVLPKSLTLMGTDVFAFCTSLEYIEIPDNIAEIEKYMFLNCVNLTSIVISENVKSIGYYSFADCDSLKNIYYKGAIEDWRRMSISNGNTYLINATVYCYSESEPALTEDGTAYDGNYWHYGADGVTPVIWTKEN